MNHNHCWHDTGITKKTDGKMLQTEACCWCGIPRDMKLRIVPLRSCGHGPYVPVKEGTEART
jgi:hypothetical protein